jgi:hypothetical protein
MSPAAPIRLISTKIEPSELALFIVAREESLS